MKKLDVFYRPVCIKCLMPYVQKGRIRYFYTRDIRCELVLLGPKHNFSHISGR
jgi:hypothetical protein